MKYSYFPGCSLKGLGRAYEESLLPVLKHLGVELKELDDWNCCGATAYMSMDTAKACVLAARNLALAEQQGNKPIMAPCAACYLVLNKTKHSIQDYPGMKETVDRALATANLRYSGGTPVKHPLDVIVNEIGLETIKKKVTRPLKGLKVAPYYGCQVVRPYSPFDDQYNPTTMDRLLEALGATVVHYPLKTRCCGSSLTGTLPEPGVFCTYVLLKEAIKRGADVISTICPLCQFNLDGFHVPIAAKWEPVRIPSVYFSQLMGLAFGMSAKQLGLHRAVVPFEWRPSSAPEPVAAAAG